MKRIDPLVSDFINKRSDKNKIKVIIQASNTDEIFNDIVIFTRTEYGSRDLERSNVQNLIRYFDHFETDFFFNPKKSAFFVEAKSNLLRELIRNSMTFLIIPRKSRAKNLFRDLDLAYEQMKEEEEQRRIEHENKMKLTLEETYKIMPKLGRSGDSYNILTSSNDGNVASNIFRNR